MCFLLLLFLFNYVNNFYIKKKNQAVDAAQRSFSENQIVVD